MSKKKAIVKVKPNFPTPPDYMAGQPDGTDLLREYVVPPRLKVVQKQADEMLLTKFGVGDVIIVPSMSLVSKMSVDARHRPTGKGEVFVVTPIFFFVEWCTWNPLELKGKSPAILARTLNPQHEIAQKAKNPDLRKETHPDHPEYQLRHVEHLNFLVMLGGGELADSLKGEPVILTFARGEHAAGRRFCSMAQMRRAPIYGCVFEVHTALRENSLGSWWGLDVSNPGPEVEPWVDAPTFEEYKAAHLRFKELHERQLVQPDYESGEGEGEDKPDM